MKKTRKLHFLLETLIVAVIILALNIGINVIFSKVSASGASNNIQALSTILSYVQFIIVPIIAVIVCYKVIEKKEIGYLTLILITLVLSLFVRYFEVCLMIFFSRFTYEVYLIYAWISLFVPPFIRALLFGLYAKMFGLPKVEAKVNDKKMQFYIYKHVLLLLFTSGIWNLIWTCRATRYLNCVEDEKERKPIGQLLLCLFVPFYNIFWVYNSAKRVDKLANEAGISSNLAIVSLILAIFVPIIPPILLQDKINAIICAEVPSEEYEEEIAEETVEEIIEAVEVTEE